MKELAVLTMANAIGYEMHDTVEPGGEDREMIKVTDEWTDRAKRTAERVWAELLEPIAQLLTDAGFERATLLESVEAVIGRPYDDDRPTDVSLDAALAIVRAAAPAHATRDYRPTDQMRDEICAALGELAES